MKSSSLMFRMMHGGVFLLLAFAPYIYLALIFFAVPVRLPLSIYSGKELFLPYLMVAVICCGPSHLFTLMASKAHVSPRRLAFWALFVKLAHIPFYLAAFLLAAALSIGLFLFGGPILGAVTVLMVYPFLLSSSLPAITALKMAKNAGFPDARSAQKDWKRLLIFGTDIISAARIWGALKQLSD